MKLVSISLAVLLVGLVPADADFVIVQKVEGASQQSGNITFKIKEDKSRIDLAPQISQLIDASTGDMITLMHSQKSYLKVSAERAKELVAQMQKIQATSEATGKSTATPKLVATGQKEKIEAWDTEVYSWSSGPLNAKYWIAKDFPNFAAIQAAMEKASGGGLAAMTKGLTPTHSEFPGMVVKTEMKTLGKTIVSTVISAEEKPVDAIELELPADYREIATPDFSFPTPAAK